MSTAIKHPTNAVEWITIDSDQAGQRIDNFLLTHLKGVPRSQVYKILRRGEVRVNKGRIKPHYRIQAGDAIRIPPLERNESLPSQPSFTAVERIKNAVLYEDKRILIINKPSGMAVHGGSGVSYGVIEALRHWRSDLAYLELVHRLDRDTSGCLILAKTRAALRQLHTLLRQGQMTKQYLALVKGTWRGGSREVNLALKKNILASGERVVKVTSEGKAALSIFRPHDVGQMASLVEVQIMTGRTHQVRVHAAHLDRPIAGDEKYGDDEFNRQMRALGLKRLFLHARRLEFTLQEPHQTIQIMAPLDPALNAVLEKLNLPIAS